MIHKIVCINGHRYTEENTYITKQGAQRCRTCNRDEQNRRRLQNQSDDMAAKRSTRVPVTIAPRPVSSDTEAWRDNAACATIGGDLWFPEGDRAAAQRAKDICDTKCDVQAACLLWALENDERDGIWGGLSEQERKQIRRQQRA